MRPGPRVVGAAPSADILEDPMGFRQPVTMDHQFHGLPGSRGLWRARGGCLYPRDCDCALPVRPVLQRWLLFNRWEEDPSRKEIVTGCDRKLTAEVLEHRLGGRYDLACVDCSEDLGKWTISLNVIAACSRRGIRRRSCPSSGRSEPVSAHFVVRMGRWRPQIPWAGFSLAAPVLSDCSGIDLPRAPRSFSCVGSAVCIWVHRCRATAQGSEF